MTDFLYEREGDSFAPTPWAGGPWSAQLQHGGPVNGLFARAIEQAAEESRLQVARITVELFRPVPKEPLRLAWRFVRRGRRVAGVEARLLRGEDDEISRAHGLLLARAPDREASYDIAPPGCDAAPPERGEAIEFIPTSLGDPLPGFHRSVRAHLAKGVSVPCLWATTPLSLVAGEATTPLVRCAMLADVTFGLAGRALMQEGHREWGMLINTDTTLYLERPPRGHWFAHRLLGLRDDAGVGLVETDVSDADGRMGRSLQALLAN
ncbi:MAG: thioesterase family protein [Myxococcota bacterium]|nr:thioesterase family protein [Myxococcota bacterium]